MTFLPILDRELRVRGRQASTYWVRCGIASLAILLSIQMVFLVSAPMSPAVQGATAFLALSWMGFLLVWASVLVTADVISHERREGTLGFLFLTDLKGYDIVLGKLVAAGLAAFYGLIGLMPALALAILCGGITWGRFGRTSLALLNALFVALAAGVWVSSRTRGQFQGMRAATGMSVLLFALPSLAFAGYSLVKLQWLLWPVLLSPVGAFFQAPEAQYTAGRFLFWGSFFWGQVLGWAFLLAAARALGKNWNEEEPLILPVAKPKRWRRLWRLRPEKPQVSRALLETAPVRWVASRLPARRVLIWVGIALSLVAVFWGFLGARIFGPVMSLSSIFSFGASLIFSWLAARFFFEARRAGELELLLCTPLGARDIVDGFWWALWRSIRVPLLVVGFLELFLRLLASAASSKMMGFGALYLVMVPANRILDIIAVCWVGMWFGLRLNRPSLIMAWTVGLVILLPRLASSILTGIGISTFGLGFGPASVTGVSGWYALISILYLGKNIFFICWAARKLQSELRTSARVSPSEWVQEEPPQ